MSESRWDWPTGEIEFLNLGGGADTFLGHVGAILNYQTFVFGGGGDYIITNLGVSTPAYDMSHIETSFDPTTGEWTVTYTRANTTQNTVELTIADIQESVGGNIGNWDPTGNLKTIFSGNPNFVDEQ